MKYITGGIFMKALFIGGTGTISTAISEKLINDGHELWLINRGNHNDTLPEGAHILTADVNDEAHVAELIKDMNFDVVADFIAFVPEQLERDYRLFKGKTKQFIFISTATVYQKPGHNYLITEGTSLCNQEWGYSRNKIKCEEYLMKLYRDEHFPVTIVRPSHTYSQRTLPNGVQGKNGTYQTIRRMLAGKPILMHGDGNAFWTLTFNRDFAVGFVGLMGNPHAIGEAVHITSDEVLTWNQIYQIMADALGVEFKPYYVASEFLYKAAEWNDGVIFDKTLTLIFDKSKLKRLVPEFKATTRWDQGFRIAMEYLNAHPEYQTEDPEFDEWCDKVIEVQEAALAKLKEIS